MKYSPEDIEKLRNQLNIVEVVGEYVELKKSGANFKGLCPFHKDNNPSFTVSPSKNICKCFVCGAGGDPLKFYTEYNKLTFPQGIKELNEKYNMGIRPVRGYTEKQDVNRKYQDIVEDALEYFNEKIFSNEGREALEYLSKRQFKPDFIGENNIGFAPKGWNNLSDHLLTKGHDIKDIVTVGLTKEGEKGHYDAFRNRVMFPIHSPSGNVIAFGGRTLEDKKEIPKYINSPESPLFHKGRNLYGIKERGSVIRRKAYSILMEGYIDVLSAHSFGFDVAVASLGTAFTDDQAKLLKRYTSNVIIAFDMDNAGRSAAEKTGILLKAHGFNIRVLELKNAKDPDEFLKKYGKQEFLKHVKGSKEIFDYLYEFYVKEYDLSNLMAKQNFVNRFKEFFKNVETDLEKSLYIDKLSKSLDVDKELLKEILIINNKKQIVEKKRSEISSTRERERKIDKLELLSLQIVLHSPELIEYFIDKKVENRLVYKIFQFLGEGTFDVNTKKDVIKVILNDDDFEEADKFKILEIGTDSMEYSNESILKNDFIEALGGWLRREIKERLEECKMNHKMAEWFKVRKIQEKMNNKALNLEEIKKLYDELKKLTF